jgi:polyhydroxyalkanoate synthesis regulator phasin
MPEIGADLAAVRRRLMLLAQRLDDARGEGLTVEEVRRRMKTMREELEVLRAEMDVAKTRIQEHEARITALEGG